VEFTKPGVHDACQRSRLSALPGPKGQVFPAKNQRRSRRGKRRPQHVVGLTGTFPGACRTLTAGDERRQPQGGRRVTAGADDLPGVESHHCTPQRTNGPNGVLTQRVDGVIGRRRPDQHRCGLEGVEARVVECLSERTDLLHGDTVNLFDLTEEQVHHAGIGEVHHEFVDRPIRPTFEDLDAHDVAADGTDTARHRTECPRTVRQPQTKNESSHGQTVRGGCERDVSPVQQLRQRWATPALSAT